MKNPFHIALPCKSIAATKAFYVDVLGCGLGREASNWIDIDFDGNQVTFTKAGDFKFDFQSYRLGNNTVPSFHFGIVKSLGDWKALHKDLINKKVEVFSNSTYHIDEVGEQYSFFVKDPNGYDIEFKAFKVDGEMFKPS